MLTFKDSRATLYSLGIYIHSYKRKINNPRWPRNLALLSISYLSEVVWTTPKEAEIPEKETIQFSASCLSLVYLQAAILTGPSRAQIAILIFFSCAESPVFPHWATDLATSHVPGSLSVQVIGFCTSPQDTPSLLLHFHQWIPSSGTPLMRACFVKMYDLLHLGAIEPVSRQHRGKGFYSRYFLVPKEWKLKTHPRLETTR